MEFVCVLRGVLFVFHSSVFLVCDSLSKFSAASLLLQSVRFQNSQFHFIEKILPSFANTSITFKIEVELKSRMELTSNIFVMFSRLRYVTNRWHLLNVIYLNHLVFDLI